MPKTNKKRNSAEKYYSAEARRALKGAYGGTHGGARPGSGRPEKPDKNNYMQVTCVLRKDTVQKLREGAGGSNKFFGAFLQFHLDRFPLPTHEEYEAMRDGKPYFKLIKRRRVPVIFAGDLKAARNGPHKVKAKDDPSREKFFDELRSMKFS